eukprot:c24723_g1_i4 orf=168-509(+)
MALNEKWRFDPVVLALNALCTFALNVSVFLVISYTSALTFRVAGVVRDWLVVLVSVYLFVDTKLTLMNMVGYGVAVAGVVAYHKIKLKEVVEKAMELQQGVRNPSGYNVPISA